MTIVYEERLSDSPYVENITHGWTVSAGSTLRPAECHWHMVFVRVNGGFHSLVAGALPTTGMVSWKEGAEILWIKFKPGTFMPHLPASCLLDKETALPGAASKAFWLNGSAWQIPDYENTDTFVDRLVRDEVLRFDPIVDAALQDQLPPAMSSRTVRHRFIQSTGLTQSHIRQIKRAQQAAELLRQGKSILDTVYEAGYFDQPHLTRSLKQWIGHTPSQLVRTSPPEQAVVGAG